MVVLLKLFTATKTNSSVRNSVVVTVVVFQCYGFYFRISSFVVLLCLIAYLFDRL